MKKTININLGGIAFIIDENAYEILHQYLETLKNSFSNQTERDEIMTDIEARMAELLLQGIASRKEVIGIAEVEAVIQNMGKPEEILGEQTATEEQKSTTYEKTKTYSFDTAKRRLFRDPDDKKVGGVIAGLCHYFGIDDPAWARLAVVLLCFLSFGTVLLIYFLLLIVIPEADTAAEKLQMKGEPVNVKTIEKEITNAASKAGESLTNLANDKNLFERGTSVAAKILTVLFKLIAGFAVFVGLIVLFAMIAALFGVTVAGNVLITELPHWFSGDTFSIGLLNAGLLLVIGIPIVGIIYGALRLIFGKRTQVSWLKWALTACWWVGVALLFVAGYNISKEFRSSATKNETIALMQPANGHLYIQLSDSTGAKADKDEQDYAYFNFGPGGLVINDVHISDLDRLPIGEPSLQLSASPNDSFYVYTFVTGRGKNKGEILTNSGYIHYPIVQNDTTLHLPPSIELMKEGKYRFQNMKIRIAIPEGKSVSFADNIDRWAATVKGDGFYDDTYFANTTWSVKDGRVICTKGENHFNEEKNNDQNY
jgi:phage shock protein C